jgi:hypothetical protein
LGKAEVGEVDVCSIVRDQKIIELEVAVMNSLAMAVGQCIDNLEESPLDEDVIPIEEA